MVSDEKVLRSSIREKNETIRELRERCANLESFRDTNETLCRRLARAELVHRRTAEHLRKERRRRRIAETYNKVVQGLHDKAVRELLGPETWESISATPEHYKGDGRVTCRRALDACAAQTRVLVPTFQAFYWWACAFKYVWRMWSKADPRGDLAKAIDCLCKLHDELASCRPAKGPDAS